MSTETKKFSAEEIAKHNSMEDLWLVIAGKVYDVTKFAAEHPGGPELLSDHAGSVDEEVTEDYENAEHSTLAQKQLEEYFIGELEN